MNKTILKSVLTYVVSVIFAIVLAGGGYYMGLLKGSLETKTIVVEGIKNPTPPAKIIFTNKQSTSTQATTTQEADFGRFWEAWSVVKSKFVSQEKVNDANTMINGAISGMVDSLEDQYTVYMPPKDAQNFTQEIAGEFSGIGAEIGLNKEKQIIIIAPLKGTPAFRAGLQAGDKIVKVDDKETFGMTSEEAVTYIRGERGTKVTLTIVPDGKTEEKKVEIIRDVIQIPTIETKRVDRNGNENSKGEYAYIRIYNFYEKASSLFQQTALKTLLTGDTKGIIIDVRNNPGGYLEAATSIAGWFIPKGEVVVKEEFQDKTQTQTILSAGPSSFENKKIVVIINKGSASASEILAGALKDKRNATLIGEKSFGKGTVQELIPLQGNAMVKVTIAHWLTPNGHLIDGNGISPDIELKLNATEKEKAYESEIDSWVKKAVEVLNKEN